MAEISHAKSHMPSRMQKDFDRKKQMPKVDKAEKYTF